MKSEFFIIVLIKTEFRFHISVFAFDEVSCHFKSFKRSLLPFFFFTYSVLVTRILIYLVRRSDTHTHEKLDIQWFVYLMNISDRILDNVQK